MQVMIRWSVWGLAPVEPLLVVDCVFIFVPLDNLLIELLQNVYK